MAATELPGQWPSVLRSADLKEKIKTARVLCVGAGGIGCELLKTLVCTGFENIEVIDLDTIETSNLNRQFLFRKHHVGASKARTAAEVISTLKRGPVITAHHANVKEPRFGVDYIKGFALVLNGLDNLEARRHVNRLAMAAGVPLVESGTAGYLGQVTVHLKGVTECFECSPKPVPKSFPICTLRNTPDKPIHCIVWAKDMLFARLFGAPEQVTDLDETSGQQAAGDAAAPAAAGQEGAAAEADPEAAAVAAAASTQQTAAERAEEASFFLRRDGEAAAAYAQRVFTRLYTTDVERVVSMKDLWKTRPPPTPLHLEALLPQGLPDAAGGAASFPGACAALGLTDPNQVWSAADNARVFLQSIVTFLTHRQQDLGQAVFDKDDDLAVEFVTAAANLRSVCYGIPTQTLFAAKGMAGNIIHAIASTNAIISGLIVTEALKLLAGCVPQTHTSYLYDLYPGGKRLVGPTPSLPPRAGCLACGKAVVTLRANITTFTLEVLVTQVLKKRLAVNVPMLLAGSFMYEEGEGLEEDEVAGYTRMLPLPLAKLPGGGLANGSLLHVSDETQVFTLDMVIQHQDVFDELAEPDAFVLEGKAEASQPEQPAAGMADGAGPSSAATPAAAQDGRTPAASAKALQVQEDADGALTLLDDDDDIVEVGAAPAVGAGALKRSRHDDDANDHAAGADRSHEEQKRQRVNDMGSNGGMAVVIDDD